MTPTASVRVGVNEGGKRERGRVLTTLRCCGPFDHSCECCPFWVIAAECPLYMSVAHNVASATRRLRQDLSEAERSAECIVEDGVRNREDVRKSVEFA